METMERIWHNLFKRKKKKFASPEAEDRDDNEKENVSLSAKSDDEDLQKVTVKASGIKELTFKIRFSLTDVAVSRRKQQNLPKKSSSSKISSRRIQSSFAKMEH